MDTLINIIEKELPIDILGDLTICEGETTTINVAGDFDSIYWDGIAGSTSQQFTTAGTHQILVQNTAGCQTDTSITIQQLPPIEFSFSSPSPISILKGETATVNVLIPEPNSNYSLNWLLPSNVPICTDCDTTIELPSQNETYTIELTDNSSNCSTTKTLEVMEIAKPIPIVHIPSAFSPNNDGINDELNIISNLSNSDIKSIHFEVYNRWGQQVFTSTTLANSWDGLHKGVVQNMGVFVYTLTLSLNDSTVINQKGNITLVR